MGKKRENLIQFFGVVILVIAFNIIFSFFFFRIDMTAEKRYTLSSSTRTLLKDLKDVVYLRQYLVGGFGIELVTVTDKAGNTFYYLTGPWDKTTTD